MIKDTLLENEVLNKFDNALRNNEFVMYLQHQVDRDGNLLGAEALARWISDGKIVSPADFIPVLEKTNQIYRLDNFIWEEAAKRLSSWKGTPLEDLSISVNISPKDIYNIDIEKKFNELRSKYNIDPGSLKLEITETAVMLDRTDGSKLVDRLKELGFEVEMDDFGSGYSSLNMLKDIKIDVLKIDMGFLIETDDEKRASVIIDSVISMAKKLGMTVIAEGVEKKSQVDFLSEMGCDVFQGYYFSKPMPVEDFEKEVRNGI
jgi:EAL domain-containing protein (putative c-di-GMP-specific phosphodiesterase class I)